jgi:Spy/CpxP family protein refolding chaperone
MRTNNARLEAAVLVFVVFVLGILLGGVGGHLWDERVEGQVQAQNAAQLNLKPTRNERVNDLTQRLQLTPEQQKQVGAVFDDTVSKWQALYAPLDSAHEQIRQQGRANIRAILTPDQQVKFDDFLKQLDEQRKKNANNH